MTEFVVEVPPGIKPGDRFTAGVGTGMKVIIRCPEGAVTGEPLNIKLNPTGGEAIILDPSKYNIFTAVCPRNKKPGDHFDVTDPTGTRMRVIVPHGVKPGQRFSVRGRGTSKKKTGLSAFDAPACAVHFESQMLGALRSKSKMGFSWRFVYTKARKTREHSLFVKYSTKSRQLRIWMNGRKTNESVLPDKLQVIHRIQLNHEGHKLLVRLIFNDDDVKAALAIDDIEFENLPQPDQLMSRQVCIPHAIGLRYAREEVGKLIASSKERHTWMFKFPTSPDRHIIVMTWSQKNVKIFVNRAQIHTKGQTSIVRSGVVFEHIFPFRGIEFRISIVRGEPGESRDGTQVNVGLCIGGTDFRSLPTSQQEFDLKHSKELVTQLERKRSASSSSQLSLKKNADTPIKAKDVSRLAQMGFEKGSARKALRSSQGDVHKALDILVAEKKKGDVAKSEDGDGDLLGDLFSGVSVSNKREDDGIKVQSTNDAIMDLFDAPLDPGKSAKAPTGNDSEDPFGKLAAEFDDTGDTTKDRKSVV